MSHEPCDPFTCRCDGCAERNRQMSEAFKAGPRVASAAPADPPAETPQITQDVLDGVTVAGARAFAAYQREQAAHQELRVAVMTVYSDPHLTWGEARAKLAEALQAEAPPVAAPAAPQATTDAPPTPCDGEHCQLSGPHAVTEVCAPPTLAPLLTDAVMDRVCEAFDRGYDRREGGGHTHAVRHADRRDAIREVLEPVIDAKRAALAAALAREAETRKAFSDFRIQVRDTISWAGGITTAEVLASVGRLKANHDACEDALATERAAMTQLAKDLNRAYGSAAIDVQDFPRILATERAARRAERERHAPREAGVEHES